MITIRIVPDIFKTEGRQELMAPYPEGSEFYLSAFFDGETLQKAGLEDIDPEDLIQSCDVWYEGKLVKPEDYQATRIEDCSEIVFFLRPGYSGLALAFYAGWGATLAALAEAVLPYIVTAVVAWALSYVVNLLFPPESSNFNEGDRNLNYGWQGVETEYAPVGSMVPIPYGRLVTGGKCIHRRVYTYGGENQRLDLLLLLGEGPIRGLRKEDDSGIIPTMTANTIAFHDNGGSNHTITDSASGFVAAGFAAGDQIVVHGSAYNNKTFKIQSVTAGTITLIIINKLTEEAAGNDVTILDISEPPWIQLDGKFISTIPDVTWNYRIGRLDQSQIPGFSIISTNYNADHRITENLQDDTWYTITNAGGGENFDSVEFNFFYPDGCYWMSDRAGVGPNLISAYFEKKEEPSGSWENAGADSYEAAKTGPFFRTFVISDLGNKPYSFRIRRHYPDTRFSYMPEGYYGDRIDLLNYNRIVNEDLRYPGCALVAIGSVASEYLSSIQPTIKVKIDGRILKYYTTSWQEETWDTGGGDDGDIGRNPAWQFHDLIYNGVYGLGPYFDDTLKVSAKFKELADYSDQMIDDGQGGTEKRFLGDVVIDGIIDPWDMLKQLMRACHCFPVVAGAQIYPVLEKDRSPVMSFGMDNVAVDEQGNTTLAEIWRTWEDIFNLVEVQYFDAEKDYDREIVQFPDDDSLIPQGEKIRKLETIFYNVTRRSQATRLAKYHWLIAQNIRKFVQFSTNEEAIALQPGDVFYFSHDIPQFDYSGKVYRARLGDNIIELDNAWDAVDTGSHTYKLLIRDLTDDAIEIKDVTAITTENKRHLVTFSGSYSFTPETGDPYILIEDTTVPIKYMCLELGRDEQMRRTISAQEYNPDIFDYTVDIEPVDYSDLPNPHDPPSAPTYLTLVEMPDRIGFFVNAVAPIGEMFYDHCRIYVSKDELTWDEVGRVREVVNFPVSPAISGQTYYVKVVSFSRHGIPCVSPPTASITIQGVPLPPKVRGLEIHNQGNDSEFIGKDCKIHWKLATQFYGLGSEDLGEEGLGLGETQPYIKDTKVSVYLDGIERRTEYVPYPADTYTYTLEKNIEDMGEAQRSFELRLWYRDNYNNLSPEYAFLAVNNTAPSLAGQTPTVSDIPYGFKIEWNPSNHHDVDKYYVYCDENNPPTTVRARVSAYETLVNIVNLDPNTTYFIKVVPGDPYGMGTASNIVQKSVPIPGVVVPVGTGDPTEVGEIKGLENALEFDDCDDHTQWTSETGGIVLATDGEALKEGTGSLKVGIDKYTCVGENLWYTIPNPPWPPQMPGAYIIGDSQNRYRTQGFKVNASCDLKRVGIPLWYDYGYVPPGCKVMIYTDNGSGAPNTKLGEATFAGVTHQEYYRWADFSTPISLTASTQYHMVFCRTDEGTGYCYYSRYTPDNYGDASYDYQQVGDSLGSLTPLTDRDAIFRIFKDEATANNHFKITSLAAKDVSDYPSLEYWIKSNKSGSSWLQASMGESALGEQTNNPAIAAIWTWSAIAWDISGISEGSRDAIAYFGFKVLDADPPANPDVGYHGKTWLWVDYIRAAKDKQIKFKFPDQTVTIYPAVNPGPGEGCINIPPWCADSDPQGTWQIGVDANQHYGGWIYNFTNADGDRRNFKVFLAKGTYTIRGLFAKNSDGGIVDIYIDSDEVASFDLYAASVLYNRIETDTGNVVAESGEKTIQIRVDGHHALSSGYYCRISALVFYRTA